MQLQPLAPTILIDRVSNVPALTLTLTPQAVTSERIVTSNVPALSLSLAPQAPSTLHDRISNVSTLSLSLTPQAPTTSVLGTTVSQVPALSLSLTPQAPSTLTDRQSGVPALSLSLTPQAPTTSVITVGTTTADIPVLSLNLTPQAPSTLHDRVSNITALQISLQPIAPTVTLPSSVLVNPSGAGSSKKKRTRKYPRWVVIDGNRYYVYSADEERRLLQAILERAQAEHEAAPPQSKSTAEKRVIRITKRLKAVDSREDEWLEHLRKQDEELLLLLAS